MALRRLPVRTATRGGSYTRVPSSATVAVALSFADLEQFETLVRRHAQGVKIYAGAGVAPRGVKDLNDATPSELRDVRITTSRPELLIRLGSTSCSITGAVKSTKTQNIVDEIARFLEQHPAYRLPVRLTWPIILACLLWHASNLTQGLFHITNAKPQAWVVIAVLVANLNSVLFGLLFDVSLSRRIKRHGAAFIAPDVTRTRFLGAFAGQARLRAMITISLVLHACVGAAFYGWL